MINVILLGQGLVANHFAVGIERIKNDEIKPYGIPLSKKDIKHKIEEIKIIGSYDVNREKIWKTIHEIAEKEIGKDVPIPETLKEIIVKEGIHLGSLKGVIKNTEGLEEKRTILDAVQILIEQWKEIRPDVVVNVITTEYGEAFNKKGELQKAIEKNYIDKLTASQVYAYTLAKYVEETKRKAAFVNVIPTPLANDDAMTQLYEEEGIPIFGDDGATGATPLTSDLLEHLAERNRNVKFIVQFNIGGNTDFLALTVPNKNIMKEETKSSIVKDILGYDAPHYIKPTGYLEPLGDKKFVSLHMEYLTFNKLKDEIYVNMRMYDSPALAGNLVDLVRLSKLCVEKKLKGTIYPINAFYMKKPGPQKSKSISKIVAYQRLIEWLKELGEIP